MDDLQNSEITKEQEKIVEKKQDNGIKLPLAELQAKLIRNALPEDVDFETILKKIEKCVNGNQTDSLYQTIVAELDPIFQERTKQLVGLLFMYKKKMCRDDQNCIKGNNCIFLHSNEGASDSPLNSQRQKRPIHCSDSPINKRRPGFKENKEVIFNKVPSDLCNEAAIKAYCEKFGPLELVRHLNGRKFLIIFEDYNSATKLVESTELPLDSDCITKFFNVMIAKDDDSFDSLFLRQCNILDEIYRCCPDKDLFIGLRKICNRIRKKVEESNRYEEPNSKVNSDRLSESLYYNQFK